MVRRHEAFWKHQDVGGPLVRVQLGRERERFENADVTPGMPDVEAWMNSFRFSPAKGANFRDFSGIKSPLRVSILLSSVESRKSANFPTVSSVYWR